MSLANLPPILILHLKRFKMTPLQTYKMNNTIEFPLYNLDLQDFVTETQLPQNTQYDLFGVVNHFGTMTGGHYTSFVKNIQTGEWLNYDDSAVTVVTEATVRSPAAYILFYQRKDVANTPLHGLVPRLNVQKFPGMPVRFKIHFSSKPMVGALLEYRPNHNCPYVVVYKQYMKLYLNEESILKDADSEDLTQAQLNFKKKLSFDATPEIAKSKDNCSLF